MQSQLLIEIQANTQAIDTIHRKLSGLEIKTKEVNNTFSKMKSLLSGITFAAATKAFTDIEDAQTGMIKTTGLQGKAFKALDKDIKRMSVTMSGFKLTDLYGIAEMGGQLGVAGKDLKNFTKVVGMIGATSDLSAEQAGTSFAKLSNVLKIPMPQLENLASAYNELSNTTTATMGYLVDSSTRLAVTGKAFGLTSMQVAGLSAELSDLGFTSEVGASSTQKILLQMQKIPEKFSSAMGMTMDEYKKAFSEDGFGLLSTFLEGFNNYDNFSQGTILKKLGLGDGRVASVVVALSQNMGQLEKQTISAQNAFDSGTSILQEYQAQANTMSGGFTRFWNILKIVGSALVAQFKPAIMSGIKYLSDFALGLMGASSELFQLAKATAGFIKLLAIGKIVQFARALLLIGTASKGMMLLRFGALGAILAIVALGDKTGTVAGKVGYLARIFNIGMKSIEVSARTAGAYIIGVFKWAWDNVGAVVYNGVSKIIEYYNSIAVFSKTLGNTIASAIVDGLNQAGGAWNDFMTLIGNDSLKINKVSFTPLDTSAPLSRPEYKEVKGLGDYVDMSGANTALDELFAQIKDLDNIKVTVDKDEAIAGLKDLEVAFEKAKKTFNDTGEGKGEKDKAGKDLARAKRQAGRDAERAKKAQEKLNQDKLESLKEFYKETEQFAKLYALKEKELLLKNTKNLTKEQAKLYAESLHVRMKKELNAKVGGLKGYLNKVFKDLFKDTKLEGYSKEAVDAGLNGITNIASSARDGGSITNDMGGSVLGMAKESGNIYAMVGAYFADFVTGFMGSKVSEAEIKKASGRDDFSGSSISDLRKAYETARNPLLPYTKKMTDYLQSVDEGIGKIARSTLNDSIDLTGRYVEDTSKETWSTKSSTTLKGSGIDIGKHTWGLLLDGEVKGYKAYLKERSRLFGLVSSSSMDTQTFSLKDQTAKAFAEVLNSGKNIFTQGALALGESYQDVMNASNIEIDIGKINLKGASAEEAQSRIQGYLDEIADKAIGGSSQNLKRLLNKFGKSSESQLQTIGRLSLEIEQGRALLDDMGINLASSTITMFGEWGKTIVSEQEGILEIMKASGGAKKFTSNSDSYIKNFYDDDEQNTLKLKKFTAQFKELGKIFPTTKKDFRGLVESLDLTSSSGRELYAQLLSMNGELASYYDTMGKGTAGLTKQAERLNDLWTSDLSILNQGEKAKFAEQYYDGLRADNKDSWDAGLDMLKLAQDTVGTRDEYKVLYDKFVSDQAEREEDASNRDLLDAINLAGEKIDTLNTTTRDSIIERTG